MFVYCHFLTSILLVEYTSHGGFYGVLYYLSHTLDDIYKGGCSVTDPSISTTEDVMGNQNRTWCVSPHSAQVRPVHWTGQAERECVADLGGRQVNGRSQVEGRRALRGGGIHSTAQHNNWVRSKQSASPWRRKAAATKVAADTSSTTR